MATHKYCILTGSSGGIYTNRLPVRSKQDEYTIEINGLGATPTFFLCL